MINHESIEHLRDRIQEASLGHGGALTEVYDIMEGIVTQLQIMANEVEAANSRARRAVDAASCLANGIQPD